ncbi:hypothetical protein PHSY_003605 [Pseudozyma hubeiensis SY62]|uniref:Uncharacterized protein n=1 Tax=Pseudozyma hubeiensis (strain SY62) TaxID=1305764 RepID=R9P3T8_PSEHS|nr:hypothetical protein PHSY_003605 [Pseudozyma hubeiensis SY62]GAC96026.1 hypothetical protein PHSY_003605 [Pseudozyma hubeiensis SY62]
MPIGTQVELRPESKLRRTASSSIKSSMVERLSSRSSTTPFLSDRPTVAAASEQARNSPDFDEELPDNRPRDLSAGTKPSAVPYNTKDEAKRALCGWAEQNGFKLGEARGTANFAYLKCTQDWNFLPRPLCKYQIGLKMDADGRWKVRVSSDVHNHSIAINNPSDRDLGQPGPSTARSNNSPVSGLHREQQSQPQVEVQHQLNQPQQQQREQALSQQQTHGHLQRQQASLLRVQQQPSAQGQQSSSRSKRPRFDSDHVQPVQIFGHTFTAVARSELQASASSIAANDRLQPRQQVNHVVTSRSFPGIDIDRLQETASGLGLRELVELSALIKYADKLIERHLRGL